MQSSRFSKSCSFQTANILSLQINSRLSHSWWNNKIINSLFTNKICNRKETTWGKEHCFLQEVSNRQTRFALIGRRMKKTFWKLDIKLPKESTLLKLKRSTEKLFHIYFLKSEFFEIFWIFFLTGFFHSYPHLIVQEWKG